MELRLLNLLLLLIWAQRGMSWSEIKDQVPQYSRASEATFRRTLRRDLMVLKGQGIEVDGYFEQEGHERGKVYALR